MKLALSFVIPLYHSAETIGPLVKRIEALTIEGGHEIVLVNDGSRDGTAEACRRLVAEAHVPIIYVEHARNYGEHNAVLSGWRQARGEHIVNLDDESRCRVRTLCREAAFGVAQSGELVHESHDRLGARETAGILSFEFSVRDGVCREGGRREHRAAALH